MIMTLSEETGAPDAGLAPRLSVIVISFNSDEVLARCLAALAGQIEPAEAELLVVGRWSSRPDPGSRRTRFPAVRWVAAAEGETVPQMRSRGLACSRGEVVALLEDDCLVPPDWCARVVAAHRLPHPAIGGPIEPDRFRTALDWGVYFCEYGRFMAPLDGIVPALPGNNVTYKREVLAGLEGLEPDRGFYEVFIHWRMQAAGHKLFAASDLAVTNVNHWTWRHVTRVPYHHGRAFAGMRRRGQPLRQRLIWAALAPLLPLVQSVRIGREVLRRGRLVGRLGSALPWIWLFSGSWGWGEWVGTLFGPGDSPRRWL